MSKQLLRAGTSIGANIFEAGFGQSTKDFIHKMYISLKETSEVEFWLIILHRTGFITIPLFDSFMADRLSIAKMIHSSIKTAKRNLLNKRKSVKKIQCKIITAPKTIHHSPLTTH